MMFLRGSLPFVFMLGLVPSNLTTLATDDCQLTSAQHHATADPRDKPEGDGPAKRSTTSESVEAAALVDNLTPAPVPWQAL